MKTALVLALGLLAGACGDDNPSVTPDGNTPPDGAMPDAPVATATFTSFTIDLVLHQTTATATPAAYATFSTLPDPDTNNASAYSSLF